MSQGADSIPVKLLQRLSAAVYARPALFIWPQILLFGLCVWFTVRFLEFDMSRNNLVGSDKRYHHNYLQYKKDFNVRDDLVAVVESEDREKNRQFVERLGAKLELETNVFSDVFYKGDLKMLGPKALLFLDEETLKDLSATLGDYEPFVRQFAKATNLVSLFSLINHQFRAASRDTNSETQSLVKAIPALQRIIDQGADALRREGMPPSPGITALFGDTGQAEESQYLTFDKGRLYIVNARPSREEQNSEAVRRLRALVEETEAEVPGVNTGITGEAVLEYDEMLQSQKDSTKATIISLLLTAALFVFSYREIASPMKAVSSLILGLGYTMAYATAAIGHLNILTVTFLPILIGLAIDYGIHLITRYEEEFRNNAPRELALQRAMVNTGVGIFTGSFTTAGAFFAMGLTDFKGIQEMGIITGGGMLVCLFPMMTFLPALLVRTPVRSPGSAPAPNQIAAPRIKRAASPGRDGSLRARVEQIWLSRPGPVAATVTVLTLLSLIPMRKVFFDYNLLHMQSAGLPAVVFEKKLIDSASKSVLFGVVVASNKAEAVRLESALTNLPTVASTDSMAKYLVGDQKDRLDLIGDIKQDTARIQFAPIDETPGDIPELSRTLWSLRGYLGLALQELREKDEPEIYRQLQALRKSIEDFRYEILNRNPQAVSRKLTAYQQALFADLHETFRALQTQDNSAGLTEQDLPGPLRSRFIGVNGKQMIQAYPKGNVWDRKDQEEFVKEIRTVDPDATGTPIQLFEYTTLLKNSYIEAAYYSLGAIVILVFIHFRRLTPVILSLLPVGIGTLWTAGIMGLFDIPFNPANIMTLPLVIGIGVTNGIHILNRFTEEQNPEILGRSTGKAVIVSALTTIAGFGSLIFAEHQGIRSLGIVMSAGVAMCMLAAITFLPAVLTLLTRAGWRIRKPSDDNAQSTLGREEPRLKPQSRKD